MIGKIAVFIAMVCATIVVTTGCGDNFIGGSDTEPIPVIPTPIHDWRAAWNPVRDIIAYEHTPVSFNDPVDEHSKLPGIYLINADGTGDSLLIYGGSYPSWSPSGDTIAYVSRFDANVYVYSLLTGESRQLTTSGDFENTTYSSSGTSSTAYSGDGRYVAASTQKTYSEPSRIVIVDILSGDVSIPRSGIEHDDFSWQGPRWMPHQSKLLFSKSYGALCILDLSTNKVELFRNGAHSVCVSMSGDSLCFIQTFGSSSYKTVLLDTNSGREVNLGLRFVECFSRDGSKLIYTLPKEVVSRGIPKKKYYLFIYDLANGEDFQLTR